MLDVGHQEISKTNSKRWLEVRVRKKKNKAFLSPDSRSTCSNSSSNWRWHSFEPRVRTRPRAVRNDRFWPGGRPASNSNSNSNSPPPPGKKKKQAWLSPDSRVHMLELQFEGGDTVRNSPSNSNPQTQFETRFFDLAAGRVELELELELEPTPPPERKKNLSEYAFTVKLWKTASCQPGSQVPGINFFSLSDWGGGDMACYQRKHPGNNFSYLAIRGVKFIGCWTLGTREN